MYILIWNIICLLANSASNLCEEDMQITENPAFPFQTIYMDHFGLIVVSEQGFKHILIVVEVFTRYIWLYPVKTTSAKEIIKHLSSLFQVFGNPHLIVSDRGTAYTSQEFEDFLKKNNINHKLVAVAAP